MRFSRETEIRKLPPATHYGLVDVLEEGNAWKQVMAHVRRAPTETLPCPIKYTTRHINMVLEAGDKQRRKCAEIFLEEWGCSGRKRPTLADLLSLLKKAQLFKAADYVAVELLEESRPSRPDSGPAAEVPVPLELLSQSPAVPTAPLVPNPMSLHSLAPTSSLLSNSSSEHFPAPTAPLLPNAVLLNLEDAPINSNAIPVTAEVHSSRLATEVEYLPGTAVINQSRSEDVSIAAESIRIAQQLETIPIEQVGKCAPQHIPYKELRVITNNFDENPLGENDGRLLGKGAFGTVHLAIQDNSYLAVKRLHNDAVNIERLFQNEVETILRVEHPNLLPMIAYSSDGPEKCLVYEYMSEGDLEERLSCQKRWKIPLPHSVRLKIAIGTAKGLNHLHEYRNPPLVHRDVKSANILLDKDLNPKVGDFGLVHLGSPIDGSSSALLTSEVFGTSIYMASDTLRGEVSVKSDVYSFGVVLLELLTGLSPYESYGEENDDLITYINEKCNTSIKSLIDRKAGDWTSNNNFDSSELLFSLAKDCLEEKDLRPFMSSVVERLQSMINV